MPSTPKPSPADPAPQLSTLQKLRGQWSHVLESIALAVSMIVAINAIGEISARQEYIFKIKAENQEARDRLHWPHAWSDGANQIHTQIETNITILKKIERLNALGAATPVETLAGIRNPGQNEPPASSWWGRFEAAIDAATLEKLLALAIVVAGAIGAQIGGLRTKDFTTFRDVGVGLGAGFITLLVIKGAKHLFVLNAESGNVLLNPYSMALAAVLAGLFSERSHQFFGKLFDAFIERFHAFLDGQRKTPDAAALSATPPLMDAAPGAAALGGK